MSAVPDLDAEELRRAVRSWIGDAWAPELTLREWWRRLAGSGWGFPAWPTKWFGKDLPPLADQIVADELAAAGVIAAPGGVGTSMGAPVLFEVGTDEQQQRWIPALARGEEGWAQFFSEPNAGSDLASVQTRAVRDGDHWIVNGQKVWNSGTRQASRAILVARTDVDVPKHKGITFFVVDLEQPGVDVRPIRQMNGREEFNETFLTDAVVRDGDRIGPVNGGWGVAMAVLTHERTRFAGGGSATARVLDRGAGSPLLDHTVGELLGRTDIWTKAANALPIGTVAAVVELARLHGRVHDTDIRQRIAALYVLDESLRLTSERGDAAAAAGRSADSTSSVAYLGGVQLVRAYRDVVGAIAGPHALLADSDASRSILTAPAHGIQGGSEQIQRNVIGERLLGLPREPQVDREVAFRDLRIGTTRDAATTPTTTAT
jgi:alkylation response protein AidB-like acyl-CoA dehydrogenase